MKEWKSVDDVLEYAIQSEEAAALFYDDLAEKMRRPSMRNIFKSFANEERGHKAKLLKIKKSGDLEPASGQIVDLKIGDYLVDVEPTPDLSYEKALILAMKREKAAFRLYSDMAAAATDANVKAIFLTLAQEEAKHKLRFEIEYDSGAMGEN